MNIQIWKTVAAKWRTLEETVQPLSIVEEVTIKAVKEIKEKGLLISAKKFLESGKIEGDDEGDWP
jgi:hypothetical protein